MSCSYLYELQRKADEFENSQRARQHERLRSFSEEEDEDVWEVPEETFDNAYENIAEHEEDEEQNKEEETKELTFSNKNSSNILHNFEIFTAQRLRLSLSAEQISLKSHQQQWENAPQEDSQGQVINKSINTETDMQTRPVVIENSNSSSASTTNNSSNETYRSNASSRPFKWKNIKINDKISETKQTTSIQLPEISLNPFILNQIQKKLPTESHIVPEIKLSLKNPSVTNTITRNTEPVMRQTDKCRKFSCSSHTTQSPHIDLGSVAEYCSSPESIIDNVLSNASSVSEQSSTLDSEILADECQETKTKNTNPFKSVNGNIENKTQNVLENITKTQECRKGSTSHPFITVTEATQSTSSSTNNGSLSATSSESYATAITNISSDPLVIHASSPTLPPQYPDELLCQLCGEIFKDPRCLNCLHAFCLQCIVSENFKDDEFYAVWPESLKSCGSTFQKKESAAPRAVVFDDSASSSTSLNAQEENDTLDALAPRQKLRASFSFKLRRPSDSPIKEKLSGRRRTSSTNFTNLEQIQTKTQLVRKITCKICQHSMDVPAGGIRQLPQNLMVMRKIHEFLFKLTDRRNSCSLCYDESHASYHCGTCSLSLCTLCKESHMRQKTTASHDIKPLERQETDEEHRSNNDIKLKCHLHQGFDIKSFCTTCLQVACSDCLILQHKGHRYEAIPKASQCYARLLKDSTDQARLVLKNTERSIDKLNEYSDNVNLKCNALQAEVEEFMKKYIEAVETHRCALLQQIKTARQTQLQAISERQGEVEKQNKEALTAVNFGQDITDTASAAEILLFVKILLRRFEQLQHFRNLIDPKLESTPSFVPIIQAPPCKEYKEIPVFGIVTTQTVEPTQCTLQWNGFSQLRLHKKVVLTLISRDVNGTPISHGGLKIQSHIKYKDVNSKCLRMEITDNNDGTYNIAFTPDNEGTIILMITINDKHIKGSPFSFLSRPVRPHTGIYHCCTFCSSKGNKFATCSCDGHMPGYSGCGHGHTGHPGHRHWSCCGDVVRNSECQFSNRSLNPK